MSFKSLEGLGCLKNVLKELCFLEFRKPRIASPKCADFFRNQAKAALRTSTSQQARAGRGTTPSPPPQRLQSKCGDDGYMGLGLIFVLRS